MTAVDRATQCIVGWRVVRERHYRVMQPMIDQLPQARQYFSDDLDTYHTLLYTPGEHRVAPGKSETYSVEGDNSDLRHYLARLARRSRCFSRSIHALRRAVRLFVYCYNQRQLYKQRFPTYPSALIDFVCP